MTYLPQILIALVSGVLAAIVTGYFAVKSKRVESAPNVIDALSSRVTKQEERIDELYSRLSEQKKEIEHWKDSYYRLLNWLKKFFSQHNIQEEIPGFHMRAAHG